MSKIIFAIIAIGYFVLPLDLIPDYFGLLGRIDDLILIAYLSYIYSKRLSRQRQAYQYGDQGKESKADKRAEGFGQPAGQLDPRAVLGLEPGYSDAQLRKAYRDLITKYHPDKVSHLGPDLQELAHKKTLEIQSAFEQLSAGRQSFSKTREGSNN